MRAPDQVVVVGASGFGRESLDVLEAMQNLGSPLKILGVLDDAPTQDNLRRLAERKIQYIGTIDEWLATEPSGARFVLGIGNPSVRRRLVRRLEMAGFSPFSAIHPSAVIGGQTKLGPGVVVCAGASISTHVRVGRYVHINPNATVGHDAVLDDFVSVNPAAVISGDVKIHEEVLVGAAALVLQQLTIGRGAIIGAGAVVTKNVPAEVVVKGVPGRWSSG